MAFRKLTGTGNSHAVTLPKSELDELGILDQDGQLDSEQWVRVDADGSGRFEIELVNVAE